MKRRAFASMAAASLLICSLASPAASAASPGSGAASVTAHAVARASIRTGMVDGTHIEVRSNVPWRLSLETRSGVVQIVGAKSPYGTSVELPAGVTAWSASEER